MEKEYYIARDLDGSLYLYDEEPEKRKHHFYPKNENETYTIDDDLFPTVTFYNSPQKVKLELIA